MTKRARRPSVARVMKELVANRSRGYRIAHVQMADLMIALADGFTREEAAAELDIPVSLVNSLLQRQYMGDMIDMVARARDEAMAMPQAPWVYAGGDALFEPVLMVPALECDGG